MNSRCVLRSLISAALLTITAVISAHANDLTGSSSLSLPSSIRHHGAGTVGGRTNSI
jgi:hypothetical protein